MERCTTSAELACPGNPVQAPLEPATAGLAGTHDLRGEAQARLARQRVTERVRRYAVLIGQQAQAARGEYGLDEADQGLDVAKLIDQVGTEKYRYAQIGGGMAPVKLEGAEIIEAVEAGVVGGETEGAGVVIAEGDA